MSLVRLSRAFKGSLAPSRVAAGRSMTTIPSAEEHATGMEKRELEAGQLMPTGSYMASDNEGTKDNPVVIYSTRGERTVGITFTESPFIEWFNVREGGVHHVEKYDKYFVLKHPDH